MKVGELVIISGVVEKKLSVDIKTDSGATVPYPVYKLLNKVYV